MGIETIPVSGSSLPEHVARVVLQRHADALPDLAGLIVLVPNHRAGQDVLRVLAAQANLPALVPPFVTPLKAWADGHAASEAEPVSRRHARLYALLKTQLWLGNVDKWALAQELLKLADQLSAARPDGRIPDALRAVEKAPSQEVALVEAVWASLNGSGTDPHSRYAAALDSIATSASAPLYVFAPGPLTETEKRFLENYARRQPVALFELAAETPVGKCLQAAWFADEAPISARAASLASAYAGSPLREHIKLCAAPHLEAEARAGATWVAEQLQAGRHNIALIALDRLTARRVRALLERLDVLIEDETGWTFTTTSAAAVVDRWLTCLADDFPHVELLDLLKSPFLLGEPADRQDAVLQLELAMRKQCVSQGRSNIWRLAQNDKKLEQTIPLLDKLFGTAQKFSMRRASLAAWLGRLHDSLAQLNALSPLGNDAAGKQLLDRLETLRHELAEDTETHSFAEWRRWLDWVLESETFSDKSVKSPIVLTSLPNARGRVFDAVAVLGADAKHLPGVSATGLFNQSVHASLGLPGHEEHYTQLRDDLLLLATQGNTLFTWQAWNGDEPNPASPFITLLQTLQRAAWNCEFETENIAEPPALSSPIPRVAHMPVPAVSAAQLPRKYSPTAYQTLLDCPYRFFARHVLGLKELDEADAVLDKSDYGNVLHTILKRFHDSVPSSDREVALALLEKLSNEELAHLPAYTAVAWKSRWSRNMASYVDFWLIHEQQGWRYQSGEKEFETSVEINGLGEIVLHGRVDRIDRNGDKLRVIDYKTSNPSTLKKRAKSPDENVQLPFYAWLAKAEAAFLPIDTNQIDLIALDPDANLEDISQRLPQLLESLAKGAPLPANGIEAACQHCEAQGMCRKGGWDD